MHKSVCLLILLALSNLKALCQEGPIAVDRMGNAYTLEDITLPASSQQDHGLRGAVYRMVGHVHRLVGDVDGLFNGGNDDHPADGGLARTGLRACELSDN